MNKSITASCLFIVIFCIIGFWHYDNIKNESQKEFNLLKHPISVIYKNQEGMKYNFSSIIKGEHINTFYEEQLIQNGWQFSRIQKHFLHKSKHNPEGGNYYLYTKGNVLLILGCDLFEHANSYYIEYAGYQ